MAVKKWTRKDLVLQNMQNFYERRTLINNKVSDNASSTIPSFLAERMKKGRKLEQLPPGLELTPCELDIKNSYDVNGVYDDDYETGYSYSNNLVLVDDIFFTWSGDEDFLANFTAKCEADVDGTVVFTNTIYDECYYPGPCYDFDFEYPDCDGNREAVDYTNPLGSSANLPECLPNTCSAEEFIDGNHRIFFSDFDDDCQVTFEISDGPGDVICVQNLFELANNVNGIVYDDLDGMYGSETYDETTNTFTWVTTDEQLAKFTTLCESFGGTAYLTSNTYGSNDCYYLDWDDYFAEEEDGNSVIPNYVDYLDCFPNTCGEVETGLLLSFLYRMPGCADENHTGVPISTKSKKSKGKKAKGMKVGKTAKAKAGIARI